MSKTKIDEVHFECGFCESLNLTPPQDDAPASRIVCNDCGKDNGSWAELQARATELFLERARRTIDDIWKGK